MNLNEIAAQFQLDGKVKHIEEYGFGNINDTYLVVTQSQERDHRSIMQRVNTHVFPRPEWVMSNIRVLTEHVHKRLQHEPTNPGRRWEMPQIIPTQDGQDYFADSDGGFWRTVSYVGDARTYETVQNSDHAREAGYALGRFHSLVSDLAPDQLHDTLEGFHIAPRYLGHYHDVVAKNGAVPDSPDVKYCMAFVEQRQAWMPVLEEAKVQNRLRVRPIHGDPKINNIMIDDGGWQAVSMIDLDTIKPGLLLYDIGDCLRSSCNPAGEETQDIEDAHFDIDLCRAILEGYLSVGQEFLDEYDYAHIYDSVRLISCELGLRFFTDYLAGDVYFRVDHETHNLRRARVQFKLAESIESQAAHIKAIVHELR